jgi:hypothetical protein
MELLGGYAECPLFLHFFFGSSTFAPGSRSSGARRARWVYGHICAPPPPPPHAGRIFFPGVPSDGDERLDRAGAGCPSWACRD